VRSLNNLRGNAAVSLGRSLKLDFPKVPAAQFEQQRRAFHQARQAAAPGAGVEIVIPKVAPLPAA